ncbi:cytochrome d ubiquinol oxidase subunit II [Phreatobacter aquaticus]|uniref:Cytochrome d ubiquinol oxidase subunit II n=1 Tax=Phreatobacter aquaticus TaxID=2570229 RepID=A0A4D7QIF0_9HYPH|nr:cytochrome d ubiquinol oxidase subunit II [Phreatobacter aquaticus]QCK86451.1 cytochrome d ubiquinol oxidase subunit II [Phreatobacter aquaticus]
MEPAFWLPVAFAVLMGVSILAYVILDGYDLGVGILLPFAEPSERDRMIASIGPFWDANETWLVLAVGLLLVAFPEAHGVILTTLYLPVTFLLIALVVRGVAFEFRAKAGTPFKRWWDRGFFGGSLVAALSQGYMLGLYVTGFAEGVFVHLFGALTAVCLAAAYAFIGSTWLLWKTEDALQVKAVRWARLTLGSVAIGVAAVSIATPLASPRIFAKWFSFPEIIALAPIPLMTGAIVLGIWIFLKRMPRADHHLDGVPFMAAAMLNVLGFAGLAYSFYPYVVPERLTVWQAAAAPESLMLIFIGTCVVLPMILGYTALSYAVFRGKATDLSYD